MEINVSQTPLTEVSNLDTKGSKKVKTGAFAEILANLQPTSIPAEEQTEVVVLPTTLVGETIVEGEETADEELAETVALPTAVSQLIVQSNQEGELASLDKISKGGDIEMAESNMTHVETMPELQDSQDTPQVHMDKSATFVSDRVAVSPDLLAKTDANSVPEQTVLNTASAEKVLLSEVNKGTPELTEKLPTEFVPKNKEDGPVAINQGKALPNGIVAEFTTKAISEVESVNSPQKNSVGPELPSSITKVSNIEEQEGLTATKNQVETPTQHIQPEQSAQRVQSEFSTQVMRPVNQATLSDTNIAQLETILQETQLTSGEVKVVKLQLEPAQLGELEITLEMFDGQVKAKLVVANQQVKELFEKSLPLMELTGNKPGVTLNNLQVEVQSQLSNSMSFSEQYQQPQHHGGQKGKSIKAGSEYGKQSFKDTQQTPEVSADRVDLLV